jgi:hypothetical protein
MRKIIVKTNGQVFPNKFPNKIDFPTAFKLIQVCVVYNALENFTRSWKTQHMETKARGIFRKHISDHFLNKCFF